MFRVGFNNEGSNFLPLCKKNASRNITVLLNRFVWMRSEGGEIFHSSNLYSGQLYLFIFFHLFCHVQKDPKKYSTRGKGRGLIILQNLKMSYRSLLIQFLTYWALLFVFSHVEDSMLGLFFLFFLQCNFSSLDYWPGMQLLLWNAKIFLFSF